MAERIVIRNTQSPGDFIVLSGALRDINQTYPGRFNFVIDVPEPSVYLHNPNVEVGPKVATRSLVAKYPLIHKSNQQQVHFLWGFLEFLNRQLGTKAVLSDFRPALYLTEEEKRTPPVKFDKPYWVMVSGGKKDFTAKVWDPLWWQVVVDRLKDKVVIVQVGGGSHIHPRLSGVHDLVAKTSLRELMRLIYHSHGVFSIVTCLMHIAAAFNKPCVTVAGGREPWWWEAYNHENRLVNMRRGQPTWTPAPNDTFVPHRYLHTQGQLDCCMNQGCWKSKVEGVGSVCVEPVRQNNVVIPRCLQMITPDLVVANWQWYYDQGILSLDKPSIIIPAMPASAPAQMADQPKIILPAKADRVQQAIASSVPPPVNPPEFHVLGYVDSTAADAEWFASALKQRTDNLLIICNGLRPELDAFCKQNGIELLMDEARPGRVALMAQAFQRTKRDWVVWIERGQLLAQDWDHYLAARFQGYTRALGGIIHQARPLKSQEERFCRTPWNRNKPLAKSPLNQLQTVVQHPAQGFMVMPQRLISDLQIPGQQVEDNDLEVFLGEAVRQYNLTLVDVGEAVEL